MDTYPCVFLRKATSRLMMHKASVATNCRYNTSLTLYRPPLYLIQTGGTLPILLIGQKPDEVKWQTRVEIIRPRMLNEQLNTAEVLLLWRGKSSHNRSNNGYLPSDYLQR